VSFLVDTNVLSELRKRERVNAQVGAWANAVGWDSLHTSWIAVAELKRGAALVRRHDRPQALALDAWIAEVEKQLGERIHPVDRPVAVIWSELMVPDPRPPLDALIAATALAHGLTLVTRNVRDFAGVGGLALLDPWSFQTE
jgi:predicted nucleic acid-binding protein